MGRRVILLGATGSIGTQTLEVVRTQKEVGIVGLAASRNVRLLEAQIREFRPKYAAMYREDAAADLRTRVADLPVKVLSGMDGILELCAAQEADTVLTAVVGMIGIRPTIAAIESGKDIALANKETLVAAGHLIMPLARKKNVRILPVDSEHSAIFQCLNGEPEGRLEKILLTASGGPFRGKTRAALERVTAADALKHPNWSMGAKVTIDSASLVNKGLEVMEAAWLFHVRPEAVEVVVQPQSIVHSMVQFVDGSVLAQLGVPDMKLPIQYALFFPDRAPAPGKRLDFGTLSSISFERPDTETFRGLALAYRAAEAGGSMPTVFNAANELAVRRFLRGEIRFLTIYEMIEAAMARHTVIPEPSLEEILSVERETCDFLEEKRLKADMEI